MRLVLLSVAFLAAVAWLQPAEASPPVQCLAIGCICEGCPYGRKCTFCPNLGQSCCVPIGTSQYHLNSACLQAPDCLIQYPGR
ncbi:hypothetical protein FJT64_011601 [Amphibalanus amphitrite]|uniref:Granulins domain-containing protein n=1 Tax=Amphibalanus amphitrite TaxID=1232801 RepID=A0A6A4VLC9_AMPAM|nr:hypothetical protein FJT64_011601 [Amphibalanus amphitrite]